MRGYEVYEETELHMLVVSAQMKHAIHCSNEKYEEYSFTATLWSVYKASSNGYKISVE